MTTVTKVSKTKKASFKKAVTAHNKAVNKSNKAFEEMSPAEKRIQIARDVLFQLNAGKLIASEGLWLGANREDDEDFISDKEIAKDDELKDLLKKRKECYGCALGGMFMCAVERANKLKVSNLRLKDNNDINTINGNDVFAYMKKFFSLKQLALIEIAFEKGRGAVSTGGRTAIIDDDFKIEVKEGLLAKYFVETIDEPSEKMRLIMENIVVNKGRFCPDKKPITKAITPGFSHAYPVPCHDFRKWFSGVVGIPAASLAPHGRPPVACAYGDSHRRDYRSAQSTFHQQDWASRTNLPSLSHGGGLDCLESSGSSPLRWAKCPLTGGAVAADGGDLVQALLQCVVCPVGATEGRPGGQSWPIALNTRWRCRNSSLSGGSST